ncbi:MAG: hypothetical protein ABSD56_12990, partial [Bryobacteraceae bacterium]
ENPVLILGLLAGAVASCWVAVKGGAEFGPLIASVRGGTAIEGAVVMVMSGVLGALLTSTAPGLERLDDQFQSAAAPRRELFTGLVALPSTVLWLVCCTFGAAFGFGLLSGAGASAPIFFAAQMLLGGVAVAAMVSAVVAILARRRLSRRLPPAICLLALAIVSPLCASAAAGSPYPLTWLAGLMPDPGRETLAPVVLVTLSLGVPAMAYAAWLLIESDPLPSRRSRSRLSVPMSTRLLASIATACGLSVARVRSVRGGLAMALFVSLIGSAGYRIWLGPSASQFSGVVGVVAVMLAAGVACSTTGDMLKADWMWATSGRSGIEIGLAWWIAVGLSSAVATTVVVLPVLIFLGTAGFGFTVMVCVLASVLTAPVTKLVPWQHDNFASQAVASTALLLLLGGSLQFVMWTGEHSGSAQVEVVALLGVVAASLGTTLLSWRRWP